MRAPRTSFFSELLFLEVKKICSRSQRKAFEMINLVYNNRHHYQRILNSFPQLNTLLREDRYSDVKALFDHFASGKEHSLETYGFDPNLVTAIASFRRDLEQIFFTSRKRSSEKKDVLGALMEGYGALEEKEGEGIPPPPSMDDFGKKEEDSEESFSPPPPPPFLPEGDLPTIKRELAKEPSQESITQSMTKRPKQAVPKGQSDFLAEIRKRAGGGLKKTKAGEKLFKGKKIGSKAKHSQAGGVGGILQKQLEKMKGSIVGTDEEDEEDVCRVWEDKLNAFSARLQGLSLTEFKKSYDAMKSEYKGFKKELSALFEKELLEDFDYQNLLEMLPKNWKALHEGAVKKVLDKKRGEFVKKVSAFVKKNNIIKEKTKGECPKIEPLLKEIGAEPFFKGKKAAFKKELLKDLQEACTDLIRKQVEAFFVKERTKLDPLRKERGSVLESKWKQFLSKVQGRISGLEKSKKDFLSRVTAFPYLDKTKGKAEIKKLFDKELQRAINALKPLEKVVVKVKEVKEEPVNLAALLRGQLASRLGSMAGGEEEDSDDEGDDSDYDTDDDNDWGDTRI